MVLQRIKSEFFAAYRDKCLLALPKKLLDDEYSEFMRTISEEGLLMYLTVIPIEKLKRDGLQPFPVADNWVFRHVWTRQDDREYFAKDYLSKEELSLGTKALWEQYRKPVAVDVTYSSAGATLSSAGVTHSPAE